MIQDGLSEIERAELQLGKTSETCQRVGNLLLVSLLRDIVTHRLSDWDRTKRR